MPEILGSIKSTNFDKVFKNQSVSFWDGIFCNENWEVSINQERRVSI